MARGLLDELPLPEAAALCSSVIEESRSGEPHVARQFLKRSSRLRRRFAELAALAETLGHAQRIQRLGIPIVVQPGFMPAVYRWAAGDEDWSGLVEQAFGGHEGDLIRAMRRLIDLLRQLAEGPEVPAATARILGQAARVVDRGIVLESALI